MYNGACNVHLFGILCSLFIHQSKGLRTIKIVINAGHTKFGIGTGAVGKLTESVETRKIACELMKLLASTDHEVLPAFFDRSDSNLKEATEIANLGNADLFISIHLNAGGGNGTEVYTWRGRKTSRALKICRNISELGFANRGVKDGSHLYVIKNTKCEAMLVEVCFVDNDIDYHLFKTQGYYMIAKAILNAL